jgi:hypothetical protein
MDNLNVLDEKPEEAGGARSVLRVAHVCLEDRADPGSAFHS